MNATRYNSTSSTGGPQHPMGGQNYGGNQNISTSTHIARGISQTAGASGAMYGNNIGGMSASNMAAMGAYPVSHTNRGMSCLPACVMYIEYTYIIHVVLDVYECLPVYRCFSPASVATLPQRSRPLLLPSKSQHRYTSSNRDCGRFHRSSD